MLSSKYHTHTHTHIQIKNHIFMDLGPNIIVLFIYKK
jgi:hypothetical protein